MKFWNKYFLEMVVDRKFTTQFSKSWWLPDPGGWEVEGSAENSFSSSSLSSLSSTSISLATDSSDRPRYRQYMFVKLYNGSNHGNCQSWEFTRQQYTAISAHVSRKVLQTRAHNHHVITMSIYCVATQWKNMSPIH